MSSAVSPEFENANNTSAASIIPRSPWYASPGWTKKEGTPVDEKVAASLRAMIPLLPIPVKMSFPLHSMIISTTDS
ncbi:MAG: Uncharacterised protein [Cryomorphaceae bacterium]|nr:MAG: Uncharacterised protein [Cryomorphaceae bacterium]